MTHPSAVAANLDVDRLERADAALVVAEEPLGRDRIDALAAFFMGRRGPEDVGPLRPGIVHAVHGRLLQQLELVH